MMRSVAKRAGGGEVRSIYIYIYIDREDGFDFVLSLPSSTLNLIEPQKIFLP